jgi:ABC-2 type transport system permease protein
MIFAAFRAEWFKLVRRPSIWVTIGLLLALTVGIGYVLTYLVAIHPPATPGQGGPDFAALRRGMYPASLVKKALSNVTTLDGVFALILGVLAQGSEYTWGTVKTAQTQLPGRLAIVFGQLASISLLVLVAVLSIFLSDAVASYLIALADGASTAPPASVDVIKGVGAMALIFEFLAILGCFLATILKQSAVAIGIGLGYVLVVEGLLFGLLVRLGDAFKTVHDLFPVANASYLNQSFGQVGSVVSITNSGAPEVSAAHAVIALVIWTIGINAISAGVVRHRDVT